VQKEATSDEERLAALKAVVASRGDAIKRSVFVAWSYYAASYYYLNFAVPPRAVRLGMDAAALKDALAGVAAWVAGATGDAPGGQPVRLPSNNAIIELDFRISGAGAEANGDVAVLSGSTADGWTLSWGVPLGTDQLAGVLPNGGACAIWISKAQFFLDGVTPNSKGNLIATVATSGSYENGFGPQQRHVFVTRGLSGNYAYEVPKSEIYSPWEINTAVYMTPAPYTQWTMRVDPDGGDLSTATRLRMALTIAYLTPSG
jgi:hypothetical protein